MQNANLSSSLRNDSYVALGAGSPEEKADPSVHTNCLQATL